MKWNQLGAFTVGVVITAVSVGAVTYVNAVGDQTLKACANKKSGVMRYISKGSCKKTEKSLSWNQMGPQGLQGTPGSNGLPGATGTTGTNGQNLYVVDADGKTLGQLLGVSSNAYSFKNGNNIWVASPNSYGFYDFGSPISFYSDAQCRDRLIWVYLTTSASVEAPFIEWNTGTDIGPNGALQKAFAPSSQVKRTFTSYSSLYIGGSGSCGLASSQMKSEWDNTARLVPAVEVEKLVYVAPLRIVQK